MITIEDISCLNDNEIDVENLCKIKEKSKEDIILARKIRQIKKISYLVRNIMIAYRNRILFDLSKNVLKKTIYSQPKLHCPSNKK